MSQPEPLEAQPKLPSEAALDLLAKCRNTLCEFDNTGAYEEADLAHVAARIRKIAAVLVRGAHLSSVLLNIDDALQTSAEDRKVEKTLETVFPGPFLLSRAKRLIRVADGLRDDFALGRLGPVPSEFPQDNDQGEPPPLAKWATWCWSNRRKRTGLVILILLIAAVWCLLTFYPRLSS
ncbi:MAG: hypothetical protein JSR66_31790 [Proteobacteria bacterium]|nr:hypothetical protein [Pseudomonadota bacterium]